MIETEGKGRMYVVLTRMTLFLGQLTNSLYTMMEEDIC